MDTIVAKYELIVYSNGEIKINPLTNLSHKDVLSKCSARMQQILSTIMAIKTIVSNNPNLSDLEVYTTAIKKVADELGVNSTTISDKLTRQLNLNAEEVRIMIFEYLRKNSPDLRNKLLKNVGKNTRQADIIAINSILL